MEVLGGVAFSYERGAPVGRGHVHSATFSSLHFTPVHVNLRKRGRPPFSIYTPPPSGGYVSYGLKERSFTTLHCRAALWCSEMRSCSCIQGLGVMLRVLGS